VRSWRSHARASPTRVDRITIAAHGELLCTVVPPPIVDFPKIGTGGPATTPMWRPHEAPPNRASYGCSSECIERALLDELEQPRADGAVDEPDGQLAAAGRPRLVRAPLIGVLVGLLPMVERPGGRRAGPRCRRGGAAQPIGSAALPVSGARMGRSIEAATPPCRRADAPVRHAAIPAGRRPSASRSADAEWLRPA